MQRSESSLKSVEFVPIYFVSLLAIMTLARRIHIHPFFRKSKNEEYI